MDIKAILEKAVQAQSDFFRQRENEKEREILQEHVDAIRFNIAFACGHEDFLFQDDELIA